MVVNIFGAMTLYIDPCLPACPPACLPARLPACLPACLSVCLPVYLCLLKLSILNPLILSDLKLPIKLN